MAENKFRNPVNNNRLLNALFFEKVDSDKSTCLYTLKDVDHEGFPSLYRLYMETDDPTEWEFAQKYLDGWEHWEMLTGCNWFKPFHQRWRKELELRMKSKALAKIKAEAKAGSKESFMANKYLLEKGWEPKDGSRHGRGRPTKEDISKAATEIAKADNRLSEDWNRLIANGH